jgi:hypothetical protein
MSAQIPTYEATVALVAELQKELLVIKTAAKKGTDDKDVDDKLEANFRKATDDLKKEKKDHQATTDDLEKIKDAFKKAEDETDKDKKDEAMKKALEMDEDYKKSKKARKGENEPNPTTEKKDLEAKVAATILEKIPIMNKILEATKLIDPTNFGKVEKELTAATLDECKTRLATIQPYIASIGLGTSTPSPQGMPGMIPFQASAAVENPANIFEAGVDEIDFSKISTKAIMEMA